MLDLNRDRVYVGAAKRRAEQQGRRASDQRRMDALASHLPPPSATTTSAAAPSPPLAERQTVQASSAAHGVLDAAPRPRSFLSCDSPPHLWLAPPPHDGVPPPQPLGHATAVPIAGRRAIAGHGGPPAPPPLPPPPEMRVSAAMLGQDGILRTIADRDETAAVRRGTGAVVGHGGAPVVVAAGSGRPRMDHYSSSSHGGGNLYFGFDAVAAARGYGDQPNGNAFGSFGVPNVGASQQDGNFAPRRRRLESSADLTTVANQLGGGSVRTDQLDGFLQQFANVSPRASVGTNPHRTPNPSAAKGGIVVVAEPSRVTVLPDARATDSFTVKRRSLSTSLTLVPCDSMESAPRILEVSTEAIGYGPIIPMSQR
jgi:hypothetical protein